jgi:hypothetical protein
MADELGQPHLSKDRIIELQVVDDLQMQVNFMAASIGTYWQRMDAWKSSAIEALEKTSLTVAYSV